LRKNLLFEEILEGLEGERKLALVKGLLVRGHAY
jgi:hypothetical protein